MKTPNLIECPTCSGGTNPQYALNPCPTCWGAQKIPQVPSLTRSAVQGLYRGLVVGVKKLINGVKGHRA